MRLIDADELPATCTVIVENGHMELTGWILAERINEAPTVDAIPIEWINKWLEVCTEDEAQTIAVMVYAWNLEKGQKENETNGCRRIL